MVLLFIYVPNHHSLIVKFTFTYVCIGIAGEFYYVNWLSGSTVIAHIQHFLG